MFFNVWFFEAWKIFLISYLQRLSKILSKIFVLWFQLKLEIRIYLCISFDELMLNIIITFLIWAAPLIFKTYETIWSSFISCFWFNFDCLYINIKVSVFVIYCWVSTWLWAKRWWVLRSFYFNNSGRISSNHDLSEFWNSLFWNCFLFSNHFVRSSKVVCWKISILISSLKLFRAFYCLPS